jgi:RND family efflux transporter MFP subunit
MLPGCHRFQRQASTPQVPPPPKVTAAKPILHEVTDYQDYTGYLEAVETVTIRARVRGFLKKVAFKEGADVKKGDPLYEIDPREYQAAVEKAKADEAKAKAELRRAESEEHRAAQLRRTNAMSEEEYTQRVVATETARATLRQAQAAVQIAELDLSFTKIESPVEGRISRTMVHEGNLVGYNEATLLTTIVRMHPIYVNFDVPEQYAIKFDQLARELSSPGSVPRIPLALAVAHETGHPHRGFVDFRENRVDSGTGTIRLRGTVTNADSTLYPGLYARIRIPESAPRQRHLVPEAALMSDQRGRYLFVIKPDQTVEARTVTVGAKVGSFIAIVTGLTGEETIIINGLQRARPGVKVDPQVVKLEEPPAPNKTTAPTVPTSANGKLVTAPTK